jgi:hypothetical protein
MTDPNHSASLKDDSDEHARDAVFKLIEGVTGAFDRDPDALKCPENERTRLAEALLPIASFIHRLLGPSYGNHLAELASALNDWNKGANPWLLERKKRRSTPLTSLESRAAVNTILAAEALAASGVSLSDRFRSINITEAISEILWEYKNLKQWVDQKSDSDAAMTIRNWQKEFSRKAGRKGVAGNDEANELLKEGRSYIYAHNGNIEELQKFARQRAGAAERDALHLGV